MSSKYWTVIAFLLSTFTEQIKWRYSIGNIQMNLIRVNQFPWRQRVKRERLVAIGKSLVCHVVCNLLVRRRKASIIDWSCSFVEQHHRCYRVEVSVLFFWLNEKENYHSVVLFWFDLIAFASRSWTEMLWHSRRTFFFALATFCWWRMNFDLRVWQLTTKCNRTFWIDL